MKCSVPGCNKDAMYKKDCLCQMHYVRRMRTGSFDLMRGGVAAKRRNVPSSRKYRRISSNGYYLIYEPKHELAQNGGYVYEHRFVLFNAYGHNINSCEICGREWSWSSIYRSHVDHINNDRTDNRVENLRPLCNSCNVKRSESERHAASRCAPITFNGKTMTAAEWAREDGVFLCGQSITRRISKGMSVEDALFSRKVTHNGSKGKAKSKTNNQKCNRKNAVAITIDGKTMTAAEWSRVDGCMVSQECIIYRIRAGVDHKSAVFSPPKAGPGVKKLREAGVRPCR